MAGAGGSAEEGDCQKTEESGHIAAAAVTFVEWRGQQFGRWGERQQGPAVTFVPAPALSLCPSGQDRGPECTSAVCSGGAVRSPPRA